MTELAEVKKFIEESYKKFPVSRLAFLVRLKSFSLFSNTIFKKLKDQYIKDYKKYKIEQKRQLKNTKRSPNPNLLKIYFNGKSFTKIAAFSYKEGLISGREASGLLERRILLQKNLQVQE